MIIAAIELLSKRPNSELCGSVVTFHTLHSLEVLGAQRMKPHKAVARWRLIKHMHGGGKPHCCGLSLPHCTISFSVKMAKLQRRKADMALLGTQSTVVDTKLEALAHCDLETPERISSYQSTPL